MNTGRPTFLTTKSHNNIPNSDERLRKRDHAIKYVTTKLETKHGKF